MNYLIVAAVALGLAAGSLFAVAKLYRERLPQINGPCSVIVVAACLLGLASFASACDGFYAAAESNSVMRHVLLSVLILSPFVGAMITLSTASYAFRLTKSLVGRLSLFQQQPSRNE